VDSTNRQSFYLCFPTTLTPLPTITSTSSLHSLLPPTPPTLLLSTTTSPYSTVSYFFRLIVTCPIALVDSAKVGYSTLQSKAQTAGASTPQTLQGGLEECLNCCLLKLAFSGWRQEPTTGQISGGCRLWGGVNWQGMLRLRAINLHKSQEQRQNLNRS